MALSFCTFRISLSISLFISYSLFHSHSDVSIIQFSKMILFPIFFIILLSLTLSECRPPELEQFPAQKSVEKDDSLVLTCSLTKGSKPITFQWFHNHFRLFSSADISITDKSSTSTLTIDHFRSENVGNYSCLAENTDGSDKSSILLDVHGNHSFYCSFPAYRSFDSTPKCGAL